MGTAPVSELVHFLAFDDSEGFEEVDPLIFVESPSIFELDSIHEEGRGLIDLSRSGVLVSLLDIRLGLGTRVNSREHLLVLASSNQENIVSSWIWFQRAVKEAL